SLAPPSAPAGTSPAGGVSAPASTPEVIAPDPIQEVFIVSADYWGHRGDDAATIATTHGLVPSVVDDNGEQVNHNRRSRCRIVDVNPSGGYVPLGSTLELTCRRGR